MITVSLQFNNEAELLAFFNKTAPAASHVAEVQVEKPAPKAKPAATPAPAPAAASSQQETAGASSASSTGASESQEAALDYEKDIKPLIVKLGAVKGRDAVMEVFKALGVDKGPSLKPAQYADAKAALVAAGA